MHPNFASLPQQLINGVLLGAIYALIALGYTMVYGVLRLINFAHGEVFMLGAYTAYFVSMAAIKTDDMGKALPAVAPNVLFIWAVAAIAIGAAAGVYEYVLRKVRKRRSAAVYFAVGISSIGLLLAIVCGYQPQAINLVLMLLASMGACCLVGMAIEFLAYRPMRNQPRISSLITAIGVSMFLQFGGQLFLPNSPPPSISEKVNPYADSIRVVVSQAPEEFRAAKKQAEKELVQAQKELLVNPASTVAVEEAKARFDAADRAEDANTPVAIRVPKGQLAIFGTTVVLMGLLTWLVLKTPAGRAMRAVSHDFDTASLMGISVSKTVTFTFAIGSALAGAGAMMNATSMGTPLTSFYGLMPGVKAFVAAVLGGIGSIPGAVLGGLLMGIAETLVTWLGWSNARDAVAFVILIAVLLFRPGGLMGSSKVEKV